MTSTPIEEISDEMLRDLLTTEQITPQRYMEELERRKSMATTKKIEDGGPAFPEKRISHFIAGANGEASAAFENVGGMSLRDWFAGKVLASVDWSERNIASFSDEDLQKMAGQIYRISDAMISVKGGK